MNVLHCVAVLALVQGIPQAAQPPLALSAIDHAAQDLFDSARDSAWTQADEHLRELQQGGQNLPTSVAPADVVDSMRARVTQLADTVPHRDRVKTMDAANAITKYAMGLNDAFPSLVPAQLPRLAYLGRQIELSVAAQDQSLFSRTVTDLRQAWQELQPQLEGRGHAADQRRMTDIVVSFEATIKLSDAESLAREERDVVSRLASAFTTSN
jgi:hypothetical protein